MWTRQALHIYRSCVVLIEPKLERSIGIVEISSRNNKLTYRLWYLERPAIGIR